MIADFDSLLRALRAWLLRMQALVISNMDSQIIKRQTVDPDFWNLDLEHDWKPHRDELQESLG